MIPLTRDPSLQVTSLFQKRVACRNFCQDLIWHHKSCRRHSRGVKAFSRSWLRFARAADLNSKRNLALLSSQQSLESQQSSNGHLRRSKPRAKRRIRFSTKTPRIDSTNGKRGLLGEWLAVMETKASSFLTGPKIVHKEVRLTTELLCLTNLIAELK